MMRRRLNGAAMKSTILTIITTLLVGHLEPVVCKEQPQRLPDRTTTTDPIRPFSDLQVVANLDWPPGNIAVTSNGRTFITFHPDGSPPFNVAEIINNGQEVEPYPSLAQAKLLFTSVLSLRIGPDDKTLWTLDHKLHATLGRPRFLVFDLDTGKVMDEYIFPIIVAPPLSFMNDFAFTSDGKGIVIVDYSALAQTPAIITLDITSRKFSRKLQGHYSVQDAGYDVFVGDEPFTAPYFGVDSIAISPATSDAGGMVYYAPLNGPVLYSIPVDDLFNNNLDDYQLAEKVDIVADKTMADGIWYNNGLVYLSDMEHGAIVTLDISNDGALTTLFKDSRIRWPDGFSQANDGYIYFTCSDLNNVSFNLGYLFHYGRNKPYQVYRFMP